MKKIFLTSLIMMFMLSSVVFSAELKDSIEDLFGSIYDMGIKDLIAPFLVVFALIYAVLNYSEIISSQNSINSIIALSFAILFSYFGNIYPVGGTSLVEAFNNSILEILVIVLAVIMLYLLLGSLGGKAPAFTNSSKGTIIVVLLSFLAVGYIFINSLGLIGNTTLDSFYREYEDQFAVILPLLIFGLLVYYITKDNSKTGTKDNSKTANKTSKKDKTVTFLEELNNIFGPDSTIQDRKAENKTEDNRG